jgi:hypothetical protein
MVRENIQELVIAEPRGCWNLERWTEDLEQRNVQPPRLRRSV